MRYFIPIFLLFTLSLQQDRQCTYHVTLLYIYATTVAVEKQYILHIPKVCVCNLRYPAWNAHSPYCHLWPVWLYYFFHIISLMAQLKKKSYWKIKRVFWFSLRLSETFLILRRNERDMIKTVYRSSCEAPIILVWL